jgi:hypothetical protein
MGQQNRPNREPMNTRPQQDNPGNDRQSTDRVEDDKIEQTIRRRASEGWLFKSSIRIGPNENLLIFQR